MLVVASPFVDEDGGASFCVDGGAFWPLATAGFDSGSATSGLGLEATEVVAKPRAGLAAGFFFFFAPPAMMVSDQRTKRTWQR